LIDFKVYDIKVGELFFILLFCVYLAHGVSVIRQCLCLRPANCSFQVRGKRAETSREESETGSVQTEGRWRRKGLYCWEHASL